MTDGSPFIEPILRGEMHFGHIPQEERLAIVRHAQAEIAEDRRYGSKINEHHSSQAVYGELSGRATRATIIGNMGALSIGVNMLRRPLEYAEDIVTHEDAVHDTIASMGAIILAYDPDKGAVVSYFANRAKSTAQRGVNKTATLPAAEGSMIAYRVSSSLDVAADSRWTPLRDVEYEKASYTFGRVLKKVFDKGGSAVRIRYAKRLHFMRHAEHIDDYDFSDRTADVPEDAVDHVDIARAVRKLQWQDLDDFEYSLVTNRFGIGGGRPFSFDRLADDYGVPVRTIEARLTRALKKLRGNNPGCHTASSAETPDVWPAYRPLDDDEWKSLAAELRATGHRSMSLLEPQRILINALYFKARHKKTFTEAAEEFQLEPKHIQKLTLRLARKCGYKGNKDFINAVVLKVASRLAVRDTGTAA
jgi:hypothetical protein